MQRLEPFLHLHIRDPVLPAVYQRSPFASWLTCLFSSLVTGDLPQLAYKLDTQALSHCRPQTTTILPSKCSMKLLDFILVLVSLLTIVFGAELAVIEGSALQCPDGDTSCSSIYRSREEAPGQDEGSTATVTTKEGTKKCITAQDNGLDGAVFIYYNGHWDVIQTCRSFERCVNKPTPHCTWASRRSREEPTNTKSATPDMNDDATSSGKCHDGDLECAVGLGGYQLVSKCINGSYRPIVQCSLRERCVTKPLPHCTPRASARNEPTDTELTNPEIGGDATASRSCRKGQVMCDIGLNSQTILQCTKGGFWHKIKQCSVGEHCVGKPSPHCARKRAARGDKNTAVAFRPRDDTANAEVAAPEIGDDAASSHCHEGDFKCGGYFQNKHLIFKCIKGRWHSSQQCARNGHCVAKPSFHCASRRSARKEKAAALTSTRNEPAASEVADTDTDAGI